MKKLIAGLLTAMALTVGLVTVAGVAPASAGYPPPPPPPAPAAPSIGKSKLTIKAGKPVAIPIASGIVGLKASGKATIKISKGPKGLSKKLMKSFNKHFSKGTLKLPKGKFKKKGTYKIKVTIGGKSKTIKIKIK